MTVPARQYFPTGHASLHDALGSPGCAPNLPAGHGAGSTVPGTQNMPSGQLIEHGCFKETVDEYVPASHSVQFAAPPVEYRPAAHRPEQDEMVLPGVSP